MITYTIEKKTTALILRRMSGEFQMLAFKFADTPHGLFRMPGGGVESEESPLDAMYREIKEEAGLEREHILFMREVGTLSYYKPLIHKKVHMFHYLFLLNMELPDTFPFTVRSQDKDNGFLWNYEWLGPGRTGEIDPELAQLINSYHLPEFFMNPASFGLDRGKVSLSDTHPEWERIYEFEEIQIREKLKAPKDSIRIYPVGSTAVSNFIAKPIIDILLEYSPGTDMGTLIGFMEDLGYFHKGEAGVQGRDYFTKGTEITTYFHLHAFSQGTADSDNLRRIVTILEGNPSYKKKYGDYKKNSLLEERFIYTENKSELMKEMLSSQEIRKPTL